MKYEMQSSKPIAKLKTAGITGALTALLVSGLYFFFFDGNEETFKAALEAFIVAAVPVAVAWVSGYFQRPAPTDNIVPARPKA